MGSPFLVRDDCVDVFAATCTDAVVTAPGSKSLTNRYLLLAGLARGESFIRNPLESDDTHYMKRALDALGVRVIENSEGLYVIGPDTWQAPDAPLFIGNAGTAMRFLAPALAIHPFTADLMGNERMAVRPIRDLVDGLIQCGAEMTYLAHEGRPPIRIRGPIRAAEIYIPGDSSSQYLSGLLMALPRVAGNSTIHITGELVSRTYVEMTLDCMRQMGVIVSVEESFRVFTIAGDMRYQAREIEIEADASTASYWFALPLMTGGSVTVNGIPESSYQGDFGLLSILGSMGADISRDGDQVRVSHSELQGIDVDMNTMSDVAPTLAVIATRAKGPTMIRNVGNMRIKECDRIATLQTAFDALGLRMTSGADWMRIEPGICRRSAIVDPEDDHRMAMVLTLLGLADGGVSVLNPGCVAKTYPRFYEEMEAAVRSRELDDGSGV